MNSVIIVSVMIETPKYKFGTPKAGDDIEELKWVSKKEAIELNVGSPTRKLFKFLGWI